MRAVSSRAAHLSHIHVHTYMGYSDLQSHGSILVCLSLPNSTMQTHTNILPCLQLTANTHSNRNNAWAILINHIETLFLWLVSLETSQVSSDSSPMFSLLVSQCFLLKKFICKLHVYLRVNIHFILFYFFSKCSGILMARKAGLAPA